MKLFYSDTVFLGENKVVPACVFVDNGKIVNIKENSSIEEAQKEFNISQDEVGGVFLILYCCHHRPHFPALTNLKELLKLNSARADRYILFISRPLHSIWHLS